MAIIIICQVVLWIWFLGCTISYRIGKKILVGGVGIKSAEFFMLCLYTLGVIAFHCLQPAGKWILFGILLLWVHRAVYVPLVFHDLRRKRKETAGV